MDMSLPSGSVTGLIGVNGAGKTTLLRVLAGILQPQTGHIIDHEDASIEPLELRARVGYMPEQVRWSGRATPRAVLRTYASLRSTPPDEKTILSTVGLTGRADVASEHLSQGMRQRLTLGTALLGSPEVLLLDEPLNGLDPVARKALLGLIRSWSDRGRAVLISSHDLEGIDAILDRVVILHRGQILFEGPRSDLQDIMGGGERIEARGDGAAPSSWGADVELEEIVEHADGWRARLRCPAHARRSVIDHLARTASLTTFFSKAADLTEVLTSLTGMDPEHTGLSVLDDAVLPVARLAGREEE